MMELACWLFYLLSCLTSLSSQARLRLEKHARFITLVFACLNFLKLTMIQFIRNLLVSPSYRIWAPGNFHYQTHCSRDYRH
jgi:hypothetical protein